MFERYSEKARRVVFFARYEAALHSEAQITTPYIVLGLKREGLSPLTASILFHRRLESAADTMLFPPRAPFRKDLVERDMPLDLDSRSVLRYAFEEADSDCSKAIEPEHLLRALLCFDNATTSTLKAVGFDLTALRASNPVTKTQRLYRRLRWHLRLILLESIWPALWRLGVLFLACLLGVLLLHWLGD